MMRVVRTVPQVKASELASPRFKANPYPFYAGLREEAPVCRLSLLYGRTAWLVTRYVDVVTVLRDDRFGKDWTARMPWMARCIGPVTRSLLNLDAPDHTRLRALAHKAFAPLLNEQLRARIEAVCDQLLNAVPPGGPLELVRDFALPLPLTVVADLLGVPSSDRLRLHGWSRRVVAATTGADILRGLPSVWRVVRYLRRLIAERRARPRSDLITALVQAEAEGERASPDELVSMVFLLLIAGYETTVNLIAGGTLELLEHPDQRARLEREPALLPSAIEELLRFTSPGDIATIRYAREEIAFGEAKIPRGDLVLAGLGSANRDPSQFSAPDTLDLAREPNRHLAFGHGVHYCLGAPLACLEASLALPALLRRFPKLGLAVPRESLRWRKSLFFRGLAELPLSV